MKENRLYENYKYKTTCREQNERQSLSNYIKSSRLRAIFIVFQLTELKKKKSSVPNLGKQDMDKTQQKIKASK